MQDIRWKQRFQNFEKSFTLLKDTINIKNTSETERAAMIKFFEMTFELAWKLLKDYLEYNGFKNINTPRDAIKQAFNSNIINNSHDWIDLLKDRNLTVHIYEEKIAKEIELKIKQKYFKIINDLYNDLKDEAKP